MFIAGALVLIVGLLGLAFSFNFVPDLISRLPQELGIYFGISAFFGLVVMFLSMRSSY